SSPARATSPTPIVEPIAKAETLAAPVAVAPSPEPRATKPTTPVTKVAAVVPRAVRSEGSKAHPSSPTTKAEEAPRGETELAREAVAKPRKAVGGGDELDELLADSAGKEARTRAMSAGATEDASLPETPARDAIAAAMTRLKPRVQACYEKERQSGI